MDWSCDALNALQNPTVACARALDACTRALDALCVLPILPMPCHVSAPYLPPEAVPCTWGLCRLSPTAGKDAGFYDFTTPLAGLPTMLPYVVASLERGVQVIARSCMHRWYPDVSDSLGCLLGPARTRWGLCVRRRLDVCYALVTTSYGVV